MADVYHSMGHVIIQLLPSELEEASSVSRRQLEAVLSLLDEDDCSPGYFMRKLDEATLLAEKYDQT